MCLWTEEKLKGKKEDKNSILLPRNNHCLYFYVLPFCYF